MDSFISLLPVLVMCAAVVHCVQYDNFEYHGQGLEDYHHKAGHHQSIDEHQEDHYDLDFHAHPKYSFDYSVKDPHTGDNKEHWETRDGDKVKGSYTILENDGTKRVVEYEADDKNGFNAVVHKIGAPKHEEYKHEPLQYQEYHEKSGHEPAYQEYRGKPAHEPVAYQHEYGHGQFDEGFVPIVGGYGH